MPTRLYRACDGLVLGSVAFLIVFPPFAFGAVHPASARVIQWVALGLVGSWAVRATHSPHPDGEPVLPRSLLAWLGAFFLWCALGLIPLPPGVLQWISPATHAAYVAALPGWPERAPFAAAIEATLESSPRLPRAVGIILPEVGDDTSSLEHFFPPGWNPHDPTTALPSEERRQLANWLSDSRGRWQQLSLAPEKTRRELTKSLAVVAIFLVVTAYVPSYSTRQRRRFERRALQGLVIVATAIAAVGLTQRATWNGKLLWFFVPWDWGIPRPEWPQTSGPFVNRNHFANYLALLWPLALMPVFTTGALVRDATTLRPRIAFLCASITIGIALLFSLSRGGWLAAIAGSATLLALLPRSRGRTAREKLHRFQRPLTFVLASAALVLATALIPSPGSGPSRGNEIDLRLAQTVADSSSLDARIAFWRDSLPLILDHPVFGVGLGAWSHSFPRYDESLRFRTQARRAHNDYVQLLSEVGIFGVFLLGGALWTIGRLLWREFSLGSGTTRPIVAAAIAGSVALMLHAAFDFGLQVLAIPVTLAILLGLALRDTWPRRRRANSPDRRAPAFALGLAALGLGLILGPLASRPAETLGPLQTSLVRAISEPTSVSARLALAKHVLPFSLEAGREILASAVALDPRGPRSRDALAIVLAQLGQDAEALAALEESVALSPFRSGHAYLAPGTASWLSAAESLAIERGFQRAMDLGGLPVATDLAVFYRDRGAFEAAAQQWLQAEPLAESDAVRAAYLRYAGDDFSRAGVRQSAREALEQSLARDPTQTKTYLVLISQVLGPMGDFEAAQTMLARARKHGADDHRVALALANAARRAGHHDVERQSLESANANHPRDAATNYRLGRLDRMEGHLGAATLALQTALESDPHLAAAWYELGRTMEHQYQFAEAKHAYAAAVREAPNEAKYALSLARFNKRLETHAVPSN